MKEESTIRKELKYFINHIDYLYLRHKISTIFLKDNNSEKDGYYNVRSLYFDNKSNDGYYEKINGIENRSKYRIRIYNLNNNPVKLEIKRKLRDIVLKESTNIFSNDIPKIISGDYFCLLQYKNTTANKVFYEFSKDFYRPCILIEYKREAFYLDVNNIRITFDINIKKDEIDLSNIFGENKDMSPVLNNNKIIMEIKYNNIIPDWVKRMLQIPRFERCAISKYTLSRYLEM